MSSSIRRAKTLLLFAAVMKMVAVPPPVHLRDSTAIAIFGGGGNHKINDPRFLGVNWSAFTQKVLVPGTRGDPELPLEMVRTLLTRGGVHPSQLVNQGFVPGLNTKGQMLWLVEQLLADPKITNLILSTSSYHMVRCMLTFIKAWITLGDGRGLTISMLPTQNPTQEMAEGVVGTNTTIEGEHQRVEDYQDKGDVATEEEAKPFFDRYLNTKPADAD